MNVWTFLGYSEPVRKAKKTVQLVKHWDDVIEKNKSFPILLQTKLDGVYAMIVVRRDGVKKVFSRTGNEFTNTEAILGAFPTERSGVYIGEMINNKCSLEVLSGLHNTNRNKPLDPYKERLKNYSYIMFHDLISIEDLILGTSSHLYLDRFRTLSNRIGSVNVIPYDIILGCPSLRFYFKRALKRGEEGVVLKHNCDWDANHKGWRMMKLVKGISLDLKALGVWGGDKGTKREGMANKISVWYNGQALKIDLGKGWTDKMRIELLEDPSIIVDKIIEITAFGRSSKGKLRQPKAGHVRIDKDEPDK